MSRTIHAKSVSSASGNSPKVLYSFKVTLYRPHRCCGSAPRIDGQAIYRFDDMRLALFRSNVEPNVFGFTADPTGCNLPEEFGPWQKAAEGTSAETYAGNSLEGLALSDPVIRAIEHDGFYLARSGVMVTRAKEPGPTSS